MIVILNTGPKMSIKTQQKDSIWKRPVDLVDVGPAQIVGGPSDLIGWFGVWIRGARALNETELMGKTTSMKPFKFSVLSLVVMVAVSTANAGYYGNDFNRLIGALEVAGLNTQGLWKLQDPTLGKNEFILPQDAAPWAGNYFPMMNGGIAGRWKQGTYPDLDKSMPSRETAKRMSPKEIAKLSPAEKMDLWNGDYEYKITRHELNVRGPYRSLAPESWEGFCNGVRCAGILTPEPEKAIEVVNRDGIRIRFEPADLKALAGASFFYVEKYADIGTPSRGTEFGAHRPNFGVIYLALKYNLAEMNQAFVVDMSLDSQLWNETAAGFKLVQGPKQQLSREEENKFPNATSKMLVKIRLKSLGEISMDQSNRSTKEQISKGKLVKETPMSGYLYLDSSGMIVEGQWREIAERTQLVDGQVRKVPDARGIDFAWFSNGRGADAQYNPENKNPNLVGTGNKYLDFDKVMELMTMSAGPKKCSSILK